MNKERWGRAPQAGMAEVRKETEKGESLGQRPRVAAKNAAAWGWLGTTIAGGVAMSFSKDSLIQGVGTGIFLTNVLGPGVVLAKDVVRGVVGKYKGQDKRPSQ